jgi:hypothetical protein
MRRGKSLRVRSRILGRSLPHLPYVRGHACEVKTPENLLLIIPIM